LASAVSFEMRGGKELAERFARFPQRGFALFRSAIQNSTIEFERAMQAKLRAGGEALSVREGALRRSLARSMEGTTLGGLKATVRIGGASAPYAGIQEQGGVIQSRQKALTIPVGPSLTPGGRRSSLFANGLKGIPRVYFVHKGERTFAFQRTGKGKTSKSRLVAVLVKQVTLLPRLRFFATWLSLESSRRAKFALALNRLMGKDGR
jgi:phage gpG-like protein